jgi:hypothetical protein
MTVHTPAVVRAYGRVVYLDERRRLRDVANDPLRGLYAPHVFFWPVYFWLALLGSPKCR